MERGQHKQAERRVILCLNKGKRKCMGNCKFMLRFNSICFLTHTHKQFCIQIYKHILEIYWHILSGTNTCINFVAQKWTAQAEGEEFISVFAAVMRVLGSCCCDYACCCCCCCCCCHSAPMLCHCLLDCLCPRGNRTSWHRLNLSQVGRAHYGQTGLLTSNVCVFRPEPFCYNSYISRKLNHKFIHAITAWLETTRVKGEECINNRLEQRPTNFSQNSSDHIHRHMEVCSLVWKSNLKLQMASRKLWAASTLILKIL